MQLSLVDLRAELERRQKGPQASVPQRGLSQVPSSFIIDAIKQKQKTIYPHGDDRRDWYEIQDPTIRGESDGVVSLMLAEDLFPRGQTLTLGALSLGRRYRFCGSENFVTQPTEPFCTGFVVSSDMIATAGHCVVGRDVASIRFVFGYKMLNESSPVLEFAVDDVYSPSKNQPIVASPETNGGVDYALVRVDRPITTHPPLKLRRSGHLAIGDGVYVLGYPMGLPLKYAGHATVKKLVGNDSFASDLDTFGGNSGSPVFSANTNVVEGLLVGGQTDFTFSDDRKCNFAFVCPPTGCQDGEQALFVPSVIDGALQAPSRMTARSLDFLTNKYAVFLSDGRGSVRNEPFTKVFSSNPVPGGLGKAFSDWYSLQAEPAPAGYAVGKVDYSLSGDRACGSWAECKLDRSDNGTPTLRFRMQGHDEWPLGGVALSIGHLIVTYVATSAAR